MNAQIESLEPRRLLSGWSTSDDFQLAAGKATYFYDIATDAAGNVYAAGSAYDATGASRDIVRMKPAGSDVRQTLANVSVPGGILELAVTPAGDVYIGTGGYGGVWRMKRSAGETTFRQVDQSDTVQGLAVDPRNGDVYAVGEVRVTISKRGDWIDRWTVRKQAGGEGPFVTVDSYTHTAGTGTMTQGVSVIPSGPAAGVYVVGAGDGPIGNPGGPAGDRWLVRRSTDGGATWSLIDNFDFDPTTTFNDIPHAVVGDPAGNVYVVGRADTAVRTGGTNKYPNYTFTYRWLTRKGVVGAGGSFTWSTADMVTTQTDYLSTDDAAIAPDGSLYVVGSVGASRGAGLLRQVVRSNAGGSGWQTVDDFQLVPGSDTEGRGIVIAPDGDVFTCGFASSTPHGFVRTLTPAATAATPMFSSNLITPDDGFASSDREVLSPADELLGAS